MKAYILSEINGTVQIGNVVFQPCTGAQFKTDRKGLKNLKTVEVKKASMIEAKRVLENI